MPPSLLISSTQNSDYSSWKIDVNFLNENNFTPKIFLGTYNQICREKRERKI